MAASFPCLYKFLGICKLKFVVERVLLFVTQFTLTNYLLKIAVFLSI